MTARPMIAVLEREALKLLRQRGRLLSAMVRPLLWLLVIGAGFKAQTFLVPGVLGMTMLFGAMLAALGTVYDKESGVMRMMLVAPLPRAWMVAAKLIAAAVAAAVQALLLLVLLALLGYAGRRTDWALLAAG